MKRNSHRGNINADHLAKTGADGQVLEGDKQMLFELKTQYLHGRRPSQRQRGPGL